MVHSKVTNDLFNNPSILKSLEVQRSKLNFNNRQIKTDPSNIKSLHHSILKAKS